MATAAQRGHVRELIDYLAGHAGQIDYPPGDQRSARDSSSWVLTEGQADHLLANGGRLQFDCSEMDAWILKCAGLWHSALPGYTGSHLSTMPRYKNGRVALAGALVVLGCATEPTGHHEVIVHTPDPAHGNPIVGSHGHPGYWLGPLSEQVAIQASIGYHGDPVFLSIAHL